MNRTLGRRLRWILAAGGAAVLLSLLPAAPAQALHDMGLYCYQCHSLDPTVLRPSSNSINLTDNILSTVRSGGANNNRGLPSTGGYPISCDYCHRSGQDVPATKFTVAKAHRHPVDTIGSGAVPNDNTTNPQEISCNDCHNGDVNTSGAPDLTPATLLTKTATDGYPDHDNVTGGYTLPPTLAANPPHLTKPYWGATLPGANRTNDGHFWDNVRAGTTGGGTTLGDIVCFVCHEAGRTASPTSAPFTGVTSTKSVRSDYVGALGTAKGHQIQTTVAGALRAGAALPCYNCHDSHGSVNHGMVLDATPIQGTSGVAVTTYNQANRPYDDRVVCASCHDTNNSSTLGTKAGGVATIVEGMYPVDPFNSTATAALHSAAGVTAVMTSGARCLGANGGCHAGPHNPVGESLGGTECSGCHNAIFAAMDNNSSTSYHHVMYSGQTGYPTNATPAGTTADRTCLTCHVDHGYFSKLVNPTHARARNLRRSILVAPDNGSNAPVPTDFDNSLNGANIYGGICTSCHRNRQTKRQPGTDIKADGMAYTYIVDNATYGPSIHGYPASASPITGHFSSDNATTFFQANCSKCHNDTLGTSFQDNNYGSALFPFALHDSTRNKLVAVMGGTVGADNVQEAMCFRCHSRTTDGVGGTQVKTVAGQDWYKKAPMDTAAEALYNLFNRTSKHPLPNYGAAAGKKVTCENCHNVHRVQAASGSIAANPDNTYAFAVYNAAGTALADNQNRSAFCLRCHDGSGPAQTADPATTLVPHSVEITLNAATMNKQPATGDNTRGHWAVNGSIGTWRVVACDGCHDKHGSSYPKLLGANNPGTGTNQINGVNVPATTTAADNAAICGSCHTNAGLGYPSGISLANIATQESYRNSSGYFAPAPVQGSVSTTRWPGKAVWDNGATWSPHNTTGKTAPATLNAGSGRQIADCNSCHDAHGTPYQYNMLNDNMTAANFELCFDCHSAAGPATDNISGSYPVAAGGTGAAASATVNTGHNIKTSGGKLAQYAALPCYDCHATHGSRNLNTQLKSDQRWAGLADTKLGGSPDNVTVDNNNRKFCLGCHVTTDLYDGYGNLVAASDNVENLSRTSAGNLLSLPTTNAIEEHKSSGTYMGCQRCHYGINYNDNTRGPHNPNTGLCDACHQSQGARSGGTATYTGPHQAHTDNTTYKIACKQCHSWTAPTNAAIHRNNTGASTFFAQVAFDCQAATWSTIQYATPAVYEYRTLFNNPYTAAAAGPYVTNGADNGTGDAKQANLHWRNSTCNNVWCHSNANPIATTMIGGGTVPGVANIYAAPVWIDNSLGTACTGCHGGDETSGEKIGDNTAPHDGSYAHLAHINNGYGCYDCHYLTVNQANSRQVDNAVGHVNGVKEVRIRSVWGASASYDNTNHTCSNVTCHGASVADWDNLASVTCAKCHLTNSDNNSYRVDSIGADIDNNNTTGWFGSGHGRTSGNYSSGNPFANNGTRFGTAADPNCANYCHATTVGHPADNNPATNYFRLATGTGGSGRTAITAATANNICLQCHSTGGAYNGEATTDVGSAHWLTHGTADNNGGAFCWDCHDPHGDNNDYMIQAQVSWKTDNTGGAGISGLPKALRNAAFVKGTGDNATGYDYMDYRNGSFTGICQTCHSAPGTKHFTQSQDNSALTTGHMHDSTPESRCTACHSHNKNFAGAGDCIGCHNSTSTDIPVNPVTAFTGSTRKHVDNVQSSDCEVCHHSSQPMDGTGNSVLILRGADNGAAISYGQADNNATSRTRINAFCLACHDSNGAQYTADGAVTNPLKPFSDNMSIKNISQYWQSTTAVSHDYPAGATVLTVPVMTKSRSPHGFPGTNFLKQEVGASPRNQGTYTNAAPVSCLQCHPAHGGNNVSKVQVKGSTTFAADNVYAGGGKMISAAEPQLCWQCHDATTQAVDDYWGDSTTAGQHWSGTLNNTFAYKRRVIASTHNVGDNTEIACSICHNPHGSSGGPKFYTPMLRGTWLTSPYYEDRTARLSGTAVNTLAGLSKLQQSRFGPRGEAGKRYNQPASGKIGNGYVDNAITGGTGHDGYYIDENTFGVTGTPASTWSSTMITANHITAADTDFAGLCTNCHGTNAYAGGTVTSMRTYLNAVGANGITRSGSGRTGWGTAIHNTVKGWASAGSTGDAVNPTKNARMRGYPFPGTRTCMSYDSGCSSGYAPWQGYNWQAVPNTANQMTGTTAIHQFPCSKCHTPHASDAARLSTTNCLDVGTVSSTRKGHGTEAAWPLPVPFATIATDRHTMAVICHNAKLTNTSTNSGWNKVTGW